MSLTSIETFVLSLIVLSMVTLSVLQADTVTTGEINTTNGPVTIIRIDHSTNNTYDVQFNPNNIQDGWQTVYSSTNLVDAVKVLQHGLTTITNKVEQ